MFAIAVGNIIRKLFLHIIATTINNFSRAFVPLSYFTFQIHIFISLSLFPRKSRPPPHPSLFPLSFPSTSFPPPPLFPSQPLKPFQYPPPPQLTIPPCPKQGFQGSCTVDNSYRQNISLVAENEILLMNIVVFVLFKTT